MPLFWAVMVLQAAFTLHGTVRLPDGSPAPRVNVTVTGQTGFSRQVMTDDMGRYELGELPRGLYTVSAANPSAPEQFCDPKDIDTGRSYGGRVLVHLYFRNRPVAAKSSRPAAAVVSVAEAAQEIPEEARKAFEEGIEHRSKQDMEGAGRSLTRAVEIYPGYFQALAERGHLYIALGKPAEAALDFAEAIRLNPHYEPALRGSGLCKFQQGRFGEAVSDLEAAVEVAPSSASSYLYLGISYLALDRQEAARTALQRALQLDPAGSVRARVHLANVYLKENQPDHAVEELKAYLLAVPDAPDAEQLRRAVSELSDRSAGRPDRFSRAVALQQAGRLQEAEQEYLGILADAPQHAEALANLGAILAQLDRHDEAVARYQAALAANPSLTPVLLNLGMAHYRRGDFSHALEQFELFLRSAPGHTQALQLAGLALVELGRDRRAIEYLSRAVEKDPSQPAVLYGLGLVYLRSRQMKEVEETIVKLDALPEGAGPAHLLRGQTWLGALEFERAALELEAAARINPSLPRLDYSLGIAHFKLGQNQDAVAALERELRRSPRDFSTLYYLALAQEAAGLTAVAQGTVRRALEEEPDSAEANALLGKLLLREGKTKEAVTALEKAVAGDPDDSEKHFLLARAYQQAGRSRDAEREFEETRRLKARRLESDRDRTPQP